LIAVTLKPRAESSSPIEEEVTPFPTPLITPPTTKMNLGVEVLGDAFFEVAIRIDEED
jgi:hypothetical protein